jgi:hypothetical protein
MYNAPEQKARRLVYANQIPNLQPDTLYEFRISYNNKDDGIYKIGEIKKFRTFPNDPEKNKEFTVAFGGNIGNLKTSTVMHKTVAMHNPYVAFVGGDFAYDSGFRQ